MQNAFYGSREWQDVRARALVRDGHRCTVARLLGGRCSSRLDVHHLIPIVEGGAPLDIDNVLTVCAACHPQLEALRRAIMRQRLPRRCPHEHRYDYARRECEHRLARAL